MACRGRVAHVRLCHPGHRHACKYLAAEVHLLQIDNEHKATIRMLAKVDTCGYEPCHVITNKIKLACKFRIRVEIVVAPPQPVLRSNTMLQATCTQQL